MLSFLLILNSYIFQTKVSIYKLPFEWSKFLITGKFKFMLFVLFLCLCRLRCTWAVSMVVLAMCRHCWSMLRRWLQRTQTGWPPWISLRLETTLWRWLNSNRQQVSRIHLILFSPLVCHYFQSAIIPTVFIFLRSVQSLSIWWLLWLLLCRVWYAEC